METSHEAELDRQKGLVKFWQTNHTQRENEWRAALKSAREWEAVARQLMTQGTFQAHHAELVQLRKERDAWQALARLYRRQLNFFRQLIQP